MKEFGGSLNREELKLINPLKSPKVELQSPQGVNESMPAALDGLRQEARKNNDLGSLDAVHSVQEALKHASSIQAMVERGIKQKHAEIVRINRRTQGKLTLEDHRRITQLQEDIQILQEQKNNFPKEKTTPTNFSGLNLRNN